MVLVERGKRWMNFSEKLRLLRWKRDLSQEQLAKMLGVSWETVCKWETQKLLPELPQIVLISKIFEVSIDQLLKDDLPIAIEDSVKQRNTEVAEPIPLAGRSDGMFCTKCGKKNEADSAFCRYCGNPFTFGVTENSDQSEDHAAHLYEKGPTYSEQKYGINLEKYFRNSGRRHSS